METVTTELRFVGEWRLWLAIPAGLLLAASAWFLYRRETRSRKDFLSWLLPALRSLAIFWLFLLLSGPILHHRTIIGQVARVLLFADASQSMNVTDDQMEVSRKLLVAQQLGWLPNDKFDSDLRQAVEEMNRIRDLLATLKPEMTAPDLKEAAKQFSRRLTLASENLGRVRSVMLSNAPVAGLHNELVLPAQTLVAREIGNDTKRFQADLLALGAIANRWATEMELAFAQHLSGFASSNDSSVRTALQKFDSLTRWRRMEALLLEGKESLLGQLAAHHQVELAALKDDKAEMVWLPKPGELTESLKLPETFRNSPTNRTTDLTTGLRIRVEDARENERVAVVLFSDGQHNAGPSPLQLAKVLGNRTVPIYTVGLGSRTPPPDLAILGVKGPDTVFQEARVKGEIQLKDDLPPGKPFRLQIEHEGKMLWERELKTEQVTPRSIPFDFSIKELAQSQLQKKDKDLKFGALPFALKVTASVVDGEKDKSNNQGVLRFSAITQKPKLLLLEGRPRWEYRYLHNLFERDDRWAINDLLVGAGGVDRQWGRGKRPGQFPPDRESLFDYQLICIGDLPANMLRPEEMEWMREFVERRGGGLIFIDGRQTKLASYLNTPLGALLPVTWREAPLNGTAIKLKLTASSSALAPLSLVSDERENAELWTRLPAPRWVASAQALPGTETLLEAAAGANKAAALVFRRYGAGRVLYTAFDESWRWRYEVGDLYHQKYWNQVSKWIMEPAYPVEDKYVSLDSGPATYAPGDTADIRVRLRDAQGRLLLKAKAEAVLSRDGQRVATVALSPDENIGGVFRGRTARLEPGSYEVRVQVDGLPSDEMKARTEFTVQPQGAGEMALLNADESLLRQMAFYSGGQYFREEDADRLLERIKPLSQGKVVESETLLWQSWWWFVPLMVLLTLEWALRKRAGML